MADTIEGFALTDEERDHVRADHMILVVKSIRDRLACDLGTAKRLADEHAMAMGWIPPQHRPMALPGVLLAGDDWRQVRGDLHPSGQLSVSHYSRSHSDLGWQCAADTLLSAAAVESLRALLQPALTAERDEAHAALAIHEAPGPLRDTIEALALAPQVKAVLWKLTREQREHGIAQANRLLAVTEERDAALTVVWELLDAALDLTICRRCCNGVITVPCTRCRVTSGAHECDTHDERCTTCAPWSAAVARARALLAGEGRGDG